MPKEYIEVEVFKRKLIDEKHFFPAIVSATLKEMPKADVVEVVRCKDCANSRPLCHTEKMLYNDDCVGCTKISTSYHSVIMTETDFCSYGERRNQAAEKQGS